MINFSDLMIGLMVIPNTIAILYLINEVSKDLFEYTKKLKNNEFKIYKSNDEDTNFIADFGQPQTAGH